MSRTRNISHCDPYFPNIVLIALFAVTWCVAVFLEFIDEEAFPADHKPFIRKDLTQLEQFQVGLVLSGDFEVAGGPEQILLVSDAGGILEHRLFHVFRCYNGVFFHEHFFL